MTLKGALDPKISIGNLIQIAVFLIALGIGWAELNARSEQTERETQRLQASIDQFAGTLELRVRALENSGARADERVSNMLLLLARIDARLERIEQRGTP